MISTTSNSLTIFTGTGLLGDGQVSAGSIEGDGYYNLNSTTLTVGGNNFSTTVGGVISGAGGSLTKTGTGTLTLSGANTYTGTTTISSGALRIENASALGSAAGGTSVASGAALELAGGISVGSEALTLSGTGVSNGGALRNVSGQNSYYGTITLGSDARIASDAGAFALGAIIGANVNLTVGGAGTTAIAAGISTGTGSLTKDGTGMLTLYGGNSYSGITTINAGTLRTAATNAIASSSALALADFSGAVFDLAGLNQTIQTLSGGGSNGGDITLSSAILTVNQTANSSFAGRISGSGGLTKTGTGTLTLSGANSYTGATTISSGALRISNLSALGSAAGGTSVASGAALELAGGISVGSEALTLSGTGVSNGGALRNISGTNSYGGAITLASDTRIASDAGIISLQGGVSGTNVNLTVGGAGDTTISGAIATGTGSLTKYGAGTLTLSGANTYTGTTTISGGALRISNGSALGSAAGGTTVAAGAALELAGGGGIAAEVLTLNGSGVAGGGALRNVSGSNTYSGAITLGSDTRIANDASALHLSGGISGTNFNLTVGGSGNTLNSGSIATGSGSLTKDGSGALFLYAGNSYSGATFVNAGALRAVGANMIASSSGLTLANVTGAVFDLNAYNQSIGTLSGGGSSGGNITLGAATLTVDQSASSLYGGTISGSGSLTKSGTGTLNLSGTNTYTGATAVNGGTLLVNGSLASSTVSVGTGGTLGGSGTIAGAVTVASGGTLSAGNSPGTLTVQSLTLSAGSNTVFELNTPGVAGGATNDRIIVNGAGAAGNLQLGGTLTATVASAGYYRLFDVTGGGTISGSFDTVTLSAPSVAGAAGTVYKSPGGASSQVNLAVVGSGQNLQFWDGGDQSGNGTVDGGAGTWNAGNTNWTKAPGEAGINAPWLGSVGVFQGVAGTVTVSGTQSFDTLQFNSDGYLLTGGSLRLGVAGGGTLNVSAGATATIASSFADGAGTGLNKVGAGTLVLTGSNTYTGGTILSAGTLSVSADANLGAAGGALTLNGGVLQVTGTGLTQLSRSIVFGANGGGFDITDVGNTFTVSQALAGGGSLTKTGAGTLVLSGTSTYTGATTVNAGRLLVDGSIASAATVNSGGVLAGSGTVGGITANGGATVAPGNSIGTLTVTGNVAFAAGSTYQVEVNAAGHSDRISASGSATLAGGTVRVLAENGNYAAATSYTILSATGGVSGQFAAVGSNLAFLTPSLSYDSQNVRLTMTRNDTSFGPTPVPDGSGGSSSSPDAPAPAATTPNYIAGTRNQGGIASAAERLGAGNPVYDALIGATADEARAGFALLSGETHAQGVAVAVGQGGLMRDTLLGHLRGPLLTPPGPAVAAGFSADLRVRQELVMLPAPVPQPRFRLWGEAYGGQGRSATDGNAAFLKSRTGGFLLGADALIAEGAGSSFSLGVAGGYSRSDVDSDSRLSSGRLEAGQAALYAAARLGAWRLDGGLGYSVGETSLTRQVRLRGFGDTLRSKRDSRVAQAFVELGYGFNFERFALEPFAQLALLRISTGSGLEQGGAAALRLFSGEQNLGFTTLGLRAEMQLGAMPVFARGLVGWRHGFGDLTPQTLTAFALGTAPAQVYGTRIDRNALVAEAGLDWRPDGGTTLGMAYSAVLGEQAQDHALKGRFEVRF
ncbi:hypothetical protein DK26_12840 [Bosea sp. WAO]|uniref:autotransporter-associated beta strand repeat-containing protein n=1 Tax=Bosea sp. WAO TaxID=406341 RepID=UPI000747FFBA|nr:autotransporter-associated beta strand repeat-containing protein [Bosea sp. WAO]KUL94963.1 hypothetical protein DK26_12840 [Bosea sp. WAO]